MARQLIVCCDGTNNNLTGRRNDTNVAQLCELLAPDSQNQLLYYDPGVGNAGELPEATYVDQLRQTYDRITSLAFGSGIYENIAEAYRFLMRHWQPGDEIYLYGFSRGAFTARSLGGLVTQFGILRLEMEAMVPTLLYLYFLDREKFQASYAQMKAQITQLFTNEAASKASVWFVGVWDTVESVGAPAPFMQRKISATPTIAGKRFHHVRHALALDEFRDKFKPRLYFIEAGYDYAAHQQSIKQEWFNGCHGDVGGSFDNHEAGLSQQAFSWMVQESAACGLRIRPDLLDAGSSLPDPVKVSALLASRAHPPQSLKHPKTVAHSQIYLSPLWALAGMSVRQITEARQRPYLPNNKAQEAVESSTVAANALRFKADTDWRQVRSVRGLVIAALSLAMLAIVAGACLLPASNLAGAHGWNKVWAAMQALPSVWQANKQFALWQVAWFIPWQAPSVGLAAFSHPARAVWVDFALIVAYGYLLARACSWAFACIAGLRRVNLQTPVWLNRLGAAPKIAILGDIFENLFTLLLLATSPSAYIPHGEYFIAAFMTAAAATKWLGLAACGLLVLWGCVANLRSKNS